MVRKIVALVFSSVGLALNAQNWQSLQGGLNNYATCLFADTTADQLIVGGRFTSAGNQNCFGIATYSNSIWAPMGLGLDYNLFAPPQQTKSIIRYNSSIIVGGWFSTAGGNYLPALATWNGNNWDTAYGALMQGGDVINDMLIFNDELYVCGSFDSIGTVPANCIAKWDGNSWSAVGGNYPFQPQGISVNKMVFYRGNLYVTGWFFDTQNNFCRLAKWDGINWTFYTNEFAAASGIYDLEVFDNKLYIAGAFTLNAAQSGIVVWNDTIWNGVAGGVQTVTNPTPYISDLIVYNNKLYAVGNYENIGGITAMGLAHWDGFTWCGFTSDFSAGAQHVGVNSINFYRDTMYVAGIFETIAGDTVNYIAKWIGGNYVDTCGNTTSISELLIDQELVVYPNPANDRLFVNYTGQDGEILKFTACNMLGQVVHTINTGKVYGESSFVLDLTGISSGVYFLTAECGGQIISKKFIKQ